MSKKKITKNMMDYLKTLKTITDLENSKVDFSELDLFSQKNRLDFLWKNEKGFFDIEKFLFLFKDGENPPIYKREDLETYNKKYKNFTPFYKKDDEILEIYRYDKRYAYENEDTYHGYFDDEWEFLTQMFRNEDNVQLVVKNAKTGIASFTSVDAVKNFPYLLKNFKDSKYNDCYMSTGYSVKEKRISDDEIFTGYKVGKEQMVGTNFMTFDIDMEISKKFGLRDPIVVFKTLEQYGALDKFPAYSYLVDSGKGVHIHILLDRNMFFEIIKGGKKGFSYENSINFHNSIRYTLTKALDKGIREAVERFNEVCDSDILMSEFKGFCDGVKVDFNLSNAGGFIRIPNTINSKTGRICKISYINRGFNRSFTNGTSVYRTNLSELSDFIKENGLYLYILEDKKSLNRGFSTQKRDEQIDKFIDFMGDNIVGFRNKTLQIKAFNEANKYSSIDKIINKLYSLNNSFTKPLNDKEIKEVSFRIAKNAIKAFKKFGGISDKKIRQDYLSIIDEDAVKLGIFCSDLVSLKNRKNITSILDAQIVVVYHILKEKLGFDKISFNGIKNSVRGIRKVKKCRGVSKKTNILSIKDIKEYDFKKAISVLKNEDISFDFNALKEKYYTYLSRCGVRKMHLCKIKESNSFVEEVIIRIIKGYVKKKNEEKKNFEFRRLKGLVLKIMNIIKEMNFTKYNKIMRGETFGYDKSIIKIITNMKILARFSQIIPNSVGIEIISLVKRFILPKLKEELGYYLYYKETGSRYNPLISPSNK